MRFETTHRFSASPDAVAAVLADPEFHLALELPDVGPPSLMEHHQDGDVTVVRLRYQYTGNLDPRARRIVGEGRLAWIQELSVDRAGLAGGLSIAADADPRRLHGRARFELTGDASGTTRTLSGELVVAVPLIGGWAEKQIQPGLLRRLDIEAAGLERRLSGEGRR